MYLLHNTNLFMRTNLLIKQDDSTRQMPTFMPSLILVILIIGGMHPVARVSIKYQNTSIHNKY
jgi:hypothetical protein